MFNTIKSRQDIERLFKQGKYIKTPHISARICRTPEQRDQEGRVAFIAGKKIGNAVFRNRCRRMLRETYRRSDSVWCGYDVALIANKSTATASLRELDRCYKMILSAMHDKKV